MDVVRLDFQQARIKQVLFKSRLRSVLYGVRAPDEALFSLRDNPLGQWLQDVVLPRYGNQPEVQQVLRLLRSMIETGQALVALQRSGALEQARQGLSQIEDYSAQIDALLHTLEQRLAAEA